MLRVTNVARGDGQPTRLRLEGRLSGPWVDELRRVCSGLLDGDGGGGLELELSEVSFVDAAGMALLRSLARSGVEFTNLSAFVAEQLKEVADAEG